MQCPRTNTEFSEFLMCWRWLAGCNAPAQWPWEGRGVECGSFGMLHISFGAESTMAKRARGRWLHEEDAPPPRRQSEPEANEAKDKSKMRWVPIATMGCSTPRGRWVPVEDAPSQSSEWSQESQGERLSDDDAPPDYGDTVQGERLNDDAPPGYAEMVRGERYAVRKPMFNDIIMRMGVGYPKIDMFGDSELHLCDVWWGPGSGVPDAMEVDWRDRPLMWCNPPYSMLEDVGRRQERHSTSQHNACRTPLRGFSTGSRAFRLRRYKVKIFSCHEELKQQYCSAQCSNVAPRERTDF